MTTAPAPRFLAVGRIGRPHGVSGEVRIEVLTDFPERFAAGATLHIGPERGDDPRPATLASVRPHQGWLLVRFDHATDRDAAADLTGAYVYIPAEEARDLEPDSYYTHQLIGLEVVTADGHQVGRVAGVLETGAADVLTIQGAEKVQLIPLIADVIAEVDLDAGRMTITPLPGLLD